MIGKTLLFTFAVMLTAAELVAACPEEQIAKSVIIAERDFKYCGMRTKPPAQVWVKWWGVFSEDIFKATAEEQAAIFEDFALEEKNLFSKLFADPEYQKLTPEQQRRARQLYFAEVVPIFKRLKQLEPLRNDYEKFIRKACPKEAERLDIAEEARRLFIIGRQRR